MVQSADLIGDAILITAGGAAGGLGVGVMARESIANLQSGNVGGGLLEGVGALTLASIFVYGGYRFFKSRIAR